MIHFKIKRIFKLLTVFLYLMATATGCSSAPQKESAGSVANAESLFQKANELEADKYYEEALEAYVEVRDQYPHLKYSMLAKLKMADIYFKQKDYVSAQVFYELFKSMHPRHRPDYVLYQLSLSYYHRLPRAIDRDLTLATKCIDHLKELLTRYPRSQLRRVAEVKFQEVQEKLAKKELYIANFYFVRKMYKSALQRYSRIIQNNSYMRLWPKALLNGSISAAEIGDSSQSKQYLNTLKAKFPNVSETHKIPRVIRKYAL